LVLASLLPEKKGRPLPLVPALHITPSASRQLASEKRPDFLPELDKNLFLFAVGVLVVNQVGDHRVQFAQPVVIISGCPQFPA